MSSIADRSREKTRDYWAAYLAERRGNYEFRCRRYRPVSDRLRAIGVRDNDLVYDIGAGMCEFGRHLHDIGLHTRYVPVDGAIDGTDLDAWRPPVPAHAFVMIEVVEHLVEPYAMLDAIERDATRGCVLTTPNADVVDVLGIDRTHRHAFRADDLLARGWRVETVECFARPHDTLLAWRAA